MYNTQTNSPPSAYCTCTCSLLPLRTIFSSIDVDMHVSRYMYCYLRCVVLDSVVLMSAVYGKMYAVCVYIYKINVCVCVWGGGWYETSKYLQLCSIILYSMSLVPVCFCNGCDIPSCILYLHGLIIPIQNWWYFISKQYCHLHHSDGAIITPMYELSIPKIK